MRRTSDGALTRTGAVIPVVHRDSAVRTAIRRGLPRPGPKVMGCRAPDRLERVLAVQLVDAVVVDVKRQGLDAVAGLRASFPRIPVFALSPFLPDDGPLLAECRRVGLAGTLVEGVDDEAAGELIAARSASRARAEALGNVTRTLRLSEPLQRAAWELVLARVGVPTRTAHIASALSRSREHLSREFAAGGAPNLKRVIDLVRIAWAADLLDNPGYSVAAVATILGFSSPSHLAGISRRIAGVTPGELAGLGPRGVIRRFVNGRMRSRL